MEIPETPLVRADGNVEVVGKGLKKAKSSKTVNEKKVEEGPKSAGMDLVQIKGLLKDVLTDTGFLAQP